MKNKKFFDCNPNSVALIAENISSFRRKQNMSQQTMAFLTGLSIATIRKYEQARVKKPTYTVMYKLATLIGEDHNTIMNERVY